MNNEKKKFVTDIIWVSISQVFNSIQGVISLWALTRSYSSEIYGQWVQVSVTVSLIAPVLTLHLGTAAVRFLAGEKDRYKRNYALGGMLTTISLFSLLTFLVGGAQSSHLSYFLFKRNSERFLVFLVLIWGYVGALFLFIISYLRARGQIKKLSIISIVFSFFKLLGIVVLTKLGYDLKNVLFYVICVEFTFFFVALFFIVKDEGFLRFNLKGAKQYIAFSVPQIPLSALLWIISTSDRFFITHYLGLSKCGIYSSSNLLGGLISLFYYPISFVLLPSLSRAWEEKRMSDIRKMFEYSVKLFLTLAVSAVAGITVLSQPLLRILITSEYAVGWMIVLLVALGTLFNGLFQINLYIIYLVKKTKWVPLIVATAALASISSNYFLIPQIGIMGAAISNIISYFILNLIVSVWMWRFVKYRMDVLYLFKVIVASIGMAVLLSLFEIKNIAAIISSIFLGFFIYIVLLIAMRSFSEQDKAIIKVVLSGYAKN